MLAIIGAGIGGCSAAYYLEDYFSFDNQIDLHIDIFDKNSKVGGRNKNSLFSYNGFSYNIGLVSIPCSKFQKYMQKFAKLSGNKYVLVEN